MKKIIVIGCPGSGKSTFSRALGDKIGIPIYHLDMMYWNTDGTFVQKSVFLERLDSAMKNDEWIIDGNYRSTMELRLAACDSVFFLDYPQDVCLDGVRARRGKARDDLPWIETCEDPEFTEFIKSYREKERPWVMELLEKYPDKNVTVFLGREQADAFLSDMDEKGGEL